MRKALDSEQLAMLIARAVLQPLDSVMWCLGHVCAASMPRLEAVLRGLVALFAPDGIAGGFRDSGS